MALFKLSSRQTLLVMATLCIAAEAFALIAQHVFGIQPCPWCILQRILYLAIAVLCLMGAAARTPALHKLFAGAALVFAGLVAATALYQHFVAAQSSSCNLTLADKIISALGLEALLPAMFQVTASCADAAVSVWGVPFDFWSLGLAGVLAAAALPVIFERRARR